MCGLAFLLQEHCDEDSLRARGMESMSLLRHRGPDANGLIAGQGFVAAHTRLSIVDLVGGQQPAQAADGRYTLVYNGEIYNFKELRAALADQWHFRDASDTEVLLAGLIAEGERFIPRLDGMWAFAFFDSIHQTLLLSRDRFGKKPLYYKAWERGFACASELPALRALIPDHAWEEDPDSVADYFRFGYPMPGRTFFRDVHEVLPGHLLVRDKSGRLQQTRYWMPSTEPYHGTRADAVVEIREKLAAAVLRRQLAADVEVGAFLSGGVDSTIVCALAQASGIGRLRTFSAGFSEPTFDERHHAARAAHAIGSLHCAQEMDAEAARKFAATIPARLGQPFGDASMVPTALVARLASNHVKVALSGDGADEVFGGYARYAGRMIAQQYRSLPRVIRRGFGRGVRAFPEPISHHSGSLLKKAHLFLALADEPPERYVAPVLASEAVLARVVPGLQGSGHALPTAPWARDADEVRHMMLMDWLVYLPQDILAKVDRATMAASLEARCPFLDRELVELAVRLPRAWHYHGLRGKRLLRDAMRGLVPDFVWSRRKQGFSAPVGHWFRAGLGDDLLELLDDGDTGMVVASEAKQLLDQHRAGLSDHSQPLWLVYGYLMWRREVLAS